jgi:hypothetical protein
LAKKRVFYMTEDTVRVGVRVGIRVRNNNKRVCIIYLTKKRAFYMTKF